MAAAARSSCGGTTDSRRQMSLGNELMVAGVRCGTPKGSLFALLTAHRATPWCQFLTALGAPSRFGWTIETRLSTRPYLRNGWTLKATLSGPQQGFGSVDQKCGIRFRLFRQTDWAAPTLLGPERTLPLLTQSERLF